MKHSGPVIGLDARWLLEEKISPHAALAKAMLSSNSNRPYDAKFVLYTQTPPSSASFLGARNVVVRAIGPSPRRMSKVPDELWLNARLPAKARDDRIDVFFSPYYKIPLFSNVVRINMIHDLSFFVLPDELLLARHQSKMRRWRLKRLMQLYCAAARYTVTVSNYSKNCLQRILRVSPAKVRVCPNGVNLDTFGSPDPRVIEDLRARLCLPAEYLLFVGSNLKKKNIEGLLEAYARLPERLRARASLVLKTAAGALRECAKCKGVYENVIILEGDLSEAEMAALISQASALALLSYDEGFGIPVAEAMAAGVPVVVSKGGALEEIAADAGMLIDPWKIEEAANAFTRILDSSTRERRKMSEKCRARAQAYSADRAGNRLFQLLREAASENG